MDTVPHPLTARRLHWVAAAVLAAAMLSACRQDPTPDPLPDPITGQPAPAVTERPAHD